METFWHLSVFFGVKIKYTNFSFYWYLFYFGMSQIIAFLKRQYSIDIMLIVFLTYYIKGILHFFEIKVKKTFISRMTFIKRKLKNGSVENLYPFIWNKIVKFPKKLESFKQDNNIWDGGSIKYLDAKGCFVS